MDPNSIAGMSMKGGRQDNFFFSLLEYYPKQDRWFLRSLLQVKEGQKNDDEEDIEGDQVIRNWLDEYDLHHLVVDIPLSYPAYHVQNQNNLKVEINHVEEVQHKIRQILDEDREICEKNPKQYEKDRNEDDMVDYSKDVMDKGPSEHILSRPFKRRLRKGFLPYWNRTIDLWVWLTFYDQLLSLFNTAYDSFGNTSLMNLFRFDYLRSFFPDDLKLYEGNYQIILVELLRANIILRKDIDNLTDLDLCVEARLDILKKIEKKLKIFIYDRDLEVLVKRPRAFESFLLAVAGKNIHINKISKLPTWTMPEKTRFVVPDFS